MTPLLQPKDVMSELGITLRQAHVVMRECRHLRIGNLLRVRPEDFAAWRAQQATKAPSSFVAVDAPSAPGVYAIRSGHYVKIGRATNIRRRLLQIQSAHPEEVTLLAVLSEHESDESYFHREFVLHRHRGEWFRIEGSVRAYLEKLGALEATE